jgi:hypothetical protein
MTGVVATNLLAAGDDADGEEASMTLETALGDRPVDGVASTQPHSFHDEDERREAIVRERRLLDRPVPCWSSMRPTSCSSLRR